MNKKEEVYNRVIKFMKDNKITCIETIYQRDKVIQNAYEFMEDLFKIVKSDLENS